MADYFFAHLSPDDSTSDIVETIKMPLASEQWVVAQLAEAIKHFLVTKRDDGNKIYELKRVQLPTDSDDWHEAYSAESVTVKPLQDVFATVEVKVDPARHVKPLQQAASEKKEVQYTTIPKYTYSEAGDYVKVDLPIGAGANIEKNSIKTEFGDRAFEIRIHDFQGSNLIFGVKKLQCRILPKDCTIRIASKGVQVKLRKKKSDDNWHSLFHSPAIGEQDSD